MKMPDKIDSKLLAPCGINCIICEKYQNPCAGCLISNDVALIKRISAIAEDAVSFHVL